MKVHIAAAARCTTAKFIPEGPGIKGPRRPAVPNSSNPLKLLDNAAVFFEVK